MQTVGGKNLFLTKLTIDKKGRLFLPKDARASLDLRPFDNLVVSTDGAKFLIAVQRDGSVVYAWELAARRLDQGKAQERRE